MDYKQKLEHFQHTNLVPYMQILYLFNSATSQKKSLWATKLYDYFGSFFPQKKKTTKQNPQASKTYSKVWGLIKY